MIIPLILVAVVVLLVVRRDRRGAGETAAAMEHGALGWTPDTRWTVLRPLARAEVRSFARHPAFLIGVALTPLMQFAATEGEHRWWLLSPALALALVPFAWLAIIAANLLVLRPRRTGADELLAIAPTPQPVRTFGLLLTGVVGVVVAAALSVAWVALAEGDAVGSFRVAEIAAGVVIVGAGVVVGVTVGRWLPHAGFGVLAVFAVSFLQARFMDPGTWPWNGSSAHPGRFLGFLADTTSSSVPQLEVRPAGWHVVYLVAATALLAIVALARDGLPRRLGAALAIAAAVIVATGWIQTRPPSDARLAVMVDYLTNPVAHQTCVDEGPTRLCAFEEQLHRVDDWMARAASIRELVPASIAARELAVVDRPATVVGNSGCGPESYTVGLHPALATRVDADAIWPADGDVHPGTNTWPCSSEGVDELFTAMQMGAWAVDLPPSPHGDDVRCDGSGQARTVVALWLAAAVTPDAAGSLRQLVDEFGRGRLTFAGWSDPPMLGMHVTGADVTLAAALLDLPASTVADRIGEAWSELTAPSTPSSALAALFDIDAGAADLAEGAGACT